ncbi:recombination regulator RecX [Collimonas pratensis]|uniref:Regulatory protein RecX n=1 Tax=Collimonas pratensis TaxID=279113 RepID=A0ABN4MGN1_9BURK|nr:recombination regulator RecX [Collimonas pratensis]AMP16795.1 recX family protein [Collimonas pratensis]NKI71941.1 recombination regulator RecX [Collimonas pratensis]
MAKLQISLKGRALRYLSAREHSRMELARKLSRYAQEGDDIEALLDTLEAAKLLSQSRFSESLIHRRAHRYGNSRILSELQSHGIDAESLVDIKADLASGEVARAREVWRKKFNRLPADAAERAKQMRFLLQRGFSHRAIQAAIKGGGNDTDDY